MPEFGAGPRRPLVILLGVTQLGLFASLLVRITTAIAQSYTPGNKVKPVQFLFNEKEEPEHDRSYFYPRPVE